MADDMSDIIPCEIARKIAVEHLDNLDDVESLSLVCSSWRSETSDINYTNFFPSKNTRLPWLMLADSPSSLFRRFYNLSKRMFLKIDIPPFEHDLNHNHNHDNRRFFSSKGWLITVTRKQALISFYDPFTTTLIKPPSIPILCFQRGQSWNNRSYLHNFSKFIFSDNARSSSSSSSSSDFQVAVIYDIYKHVAFWRSGQQQWMKPTFEVNNVEDVYFFRGEFYSINYYARVIAYGSELPKRPSPRIVAYLDSHIEYCSCVTINKWSCFYIVPFNQNESTLLIVQRKMCNKPDKDYDMSNINTNNNPKRWWVESVSLIELNVVNNGETKLIDNIGNRALFVGLNSTFFGEVEDEAFSGKDKRCCRANSIYFTDGKFGGNHRRVGETDLRIFCLKEGKMVEPYYEGPSRYNCVNPPVWVELPHH